MRIKQLFTIILVVFATITLTIIGSGHVNAKGANPSRKEVCSKVRAMPGAQNTDYFLKDIGISRAAVVSNLRGLSFIMGRMDAEKVGWQTVLGADPSVLEIEGVSNEEQLRSSLLAALRMACE